MKPALFIARDDMRTIRGSVMTKIFIVVLISVPLFFTWFNVLATWDPFSNSDHLQIAVASTDEGYTSEVLNASLNVGDIVLKELATNDELDWVLTSEEKALEGTRSGEYYAAIVLPEDFSRSMFTFYSGGATPADITLYTNEKKNPLSANLTTQGAQGVTAQINTVFSQALAEVAVGMAEDAYSYFNDADTQVTLDRLSSRLDALSSGLNSGADTLGSLSALIGSSVPLAQGVNDLAASVQDSFEGALGGSLDGNNGVTDPFESISAGLGDSLDLASSNIAKVESRLDDLLDSADATAQSSADVVDQLKDMLDKQIAGFQETRDEIVRILGPGGTGGSGQIGGADIELGADLQVEGPLLDKFIAALDEAIARQQSLSDRLSGVAQDLRDGISVDGGSRDEARDAVEQAAAAIQQAHASFSQNLQPKIDSLRAHLRDASQNAAVFRSHLDAVQVQLSDGASGLIGAMERSRDALAKTAQGMRDGAGRLDEALELIAKVRTGDNLEEIAEVLGTDPQGFARLVSSPVDVERNAVFPVASFGVGMTPLFTAIALWVGSLLAGVFLSTEVSRNVGRRYLASIGAGEAAKDDAEDLDNSEISEADEHGSLSNPDATAAGDAGEQPKAESGDAVAKAEVESDASAMTAEAGAEADIQAEAETEAGAEADTEADADSKAETSPSSAPQRPKHSAKPVYSAAQEYLGRYHMFWLVGMAQSTLLIVGLIAFVEIKPAHPFLLILAGWVISTVFTNIIYTLVVALSNAGKAVAVVLLVLQISAAGGAYPLELLPQWFQNISPWLPATYAINLMRSAISGIYAGDFIQNLGMILLFVIPNLIVGLALRRALASNIAKMTEAMEKTKVM